MSSNIDVIQLEQSRDGYWRWRLRVERRNGKRAEIAGRERFSCADLCRADGRYVLRSFRAGNGALRKSIEIWEQTIA